MCESICSGTEEMLKEYLLLLNLKPASGGPSRTCSRKVMEEFTVKHQRSVASQALPQNLGAVGRQRLGSFP